MEEDLIPIRRPVGLGEQETAEYQDSARAEQEAAWEALTSIRDAEDPEGADDDGGEEGGEEPGEFDSLEGFINTQVQDVKDILNIYRGAAQGVARAANETANAAVDVGGWLLAKTGAYKLLGDDEWDEYWMEWYQNGADNPVNIPVGDRMEGVAGLTEAIFQVGAGLFGAGKVTKASKFLSGLSTGRRAVAAGTIADFAAFDPHEARLVDLLGEWGLAPDAAVEALGADETDTPMEGRVKNVLEGALVGSALGLAIGMTKRAFRNSPRSTPTTVEEFEEAKRALEEDMIRYEERATVEVIPHTVDGQEVFQVQAKAEMRERLREILPEPVTYESAADAQRAAAAFDLGVKMRGGRRFSSIQGVERERLAGSFREMAETLDNPSLGERAAEAAMDTFRKGFMAMTGQSFGRNADEALEDVFNPLRLDAEDSTKQTLANVADIAADGIAAARNLSTDGRWSQRLVRQVARDLGNIPEDQLLKSAQKLFGVTETLPQHLLAIRYTLTGKAARVHRISNAIQPGKGADPFLARMWAQEMDELINLSMALAGNTSNVARALKQFDIHVDDLKQVIRNESTEAAKANPRPHQNTLGPGEWADDFTKGIKAANTPAEGRDVARAAAERMKAQMQGKLRDPNRWTWDPSEPWSHAWGKKAMKGKPFTSMFMDGAVSPREMAAMSRTIQATGGDPKLVLQAVEAMVGETAQNVQAVARDLPIGERIGAEVATLRSFSMLTGPTTHQANVIGTVGGYAAKVIERGLEGVFLGDQYAIREAGELAFGPLLDGGMILSDAYKFAKRALWTNRAFLDPMQTKFEEQLLVQPGGSMGSLGDFYRFVTGLSHRALLTADEFLKRTAYHNYVRSKSITSYRRENGLGAFDRLNADQAKELADRVADDVVFSTAGSGQALDREALSFSQEVTYTDPLARGSWQELLAATMDKLPLGIGHAIMPYKRTPLNLFSFVGRRTPILNKLSRQHREWMRSGDPELVAKARAQSAMGSILYGVAAWMTFGFDGVVTGSAPSNPHARRQMLEGGWKPYTVMFPDGTEMEYRRMQPISAPLAIMADMNAAWGEIQSDPRKREEAISTMVAAFSASMTDQNFLISFTEFFDALGNGDAKALQRYGESFATSFAPALGRQMNPDRVWRETSTWWEAFKADLPVFSESLEPRKNAFGEVLLKNGRRQYVEDTTGNEFLTWVNQGNVLSRTDRNDRDPILMRLAAIEVNLPKPQPRDPVTGINYQDRTKYTPVPGAPARPGQSPYDRWLEILYENDVRGEIEFILRGATGVDVDGKTVVQATKVYEKMKEAAKNQMLSEYGLLEDDQAAPINQRIELLETSIPNLDITRVR